jgi:hypothetical protein
MAPWGCVCLARTQDLVQCEVWRSRFRQGSGASASLDLSVLI